MRKLRLKLNYLKKLARDAWRSRLGSKNELVPATMMNLIYFTVQPEDKSPEEALERFRRAYSKDIVGLYSEPLTEMLYSNSLGASLKRHQESWHKNEALIYLNPIAIKQRFPTANQALAAAYVSKHEEAHARDASTANGGVGIDNKYLNLFPLHDTARRESFADGYGLLSCIANSEFSERDIRAFLDQLIEDRKRHRATHRGTRKIMKEIRRDFSDLRGQFKSCPIRERDALRDKLAVRYANRYRPQIPEIWTAQVINIGHDMRSLASHLKHKALSKLHVKPRTQAASRHRAGPSPRANKSNKLEP